MKKDIREALDNCVHNGYEEDLKQSPEDIAYELIEHGIIGSICDDYLKEIKKWKQ